MKNRHSIRLQGYDYSKPGYYFVTICIYDRNQFMFGNVISGKMELNDFGCIVRDELLKTEQMRPNIKIDEYVIMPNHCHVIFNIQNVEIFQNRRGMLQRAPTVERFGKPTSNSIPTIIRLIKSTITKQINVIRNTPFADVWQRNYYEHIMRDEISLLRIRQYIQENPIHWTNDSENHISHEIDDLELIEFEIF